jgi:NAD(P)H-dependent FMN reductase
VDLDGSSFTAAHMKIVTLSGSLRAGSTNSALVRTFASLAPPGMTVVAVDIGVLPLFNPDLETALPGAVVRFHAEIAAADAVVIASPEYAHGVSGVIKNALDWLVGLEGFAGKPVAVLNAAPRAHHADAALRETLTTMAAVIVNGASFVVPLAGSPEQVSDRLGSMAVAAIINSVWTAISAESGCADSARPAS